MIVASTGNRKKMIPAAVLSSNSDEWETPQDLFDELDAEFDFDLDPCATDENHKTLVYFTKEEDGLSKSWGGCNVFCNPPYSQIDKWVEKAHDEGIKDNTIVVLLIPARVDTDYFHRFILHRAEVRYIRGRLRFSGAKWNAPFASIVVIFRGAERKAK